MTKGSSSAQTPSPRIAAPAVPLLSNATATGVAIAHPLLLLALFAWRFNDLVVDPASTLQTALPVVAAIQFAYMFLCLPVIGSQNNKTSKKPRLGEKKKAESAGPNSIVVCLLALLLSAIATPVLHVLFVLFGAPFLTHIPHTFLCCAHISILSLSPVFYVHGVDAPSLRAVLAVAAPLDQAFGGFVGAFAGAWLGAVPIPLDWDREWQKWPVTIVTGAYIGYLIGSKLLGTVFFGKCWATPDVKEETKEE